MSDGERTYLSMIVPRGIGADLYHGAEVWCVAVLTDVNVALGTNQLRIISSDPDRAKMERHRDALEQQDFGKAYFLIHYEATE